MPWAMGPGPLGKQMPMIALALHYATLATLASTSYNRLALKLVLDQQHKTLYPEHKTLNKYQSLSKAGGESKEIPNPGAYDPKPDAGYQNGRYAVGYASVGTASRSLGS